jgi:CubicO group peptidase (beta-lactamase class C family)
VAPLRFDDGWPVSTLDAENIDRPALERFIQMLVDMPMDSQDALQIHGALIARHGKVVLEEYFHGEHRDKLHMTRSAAKSVTAVLVGAVIQSGAPLKLSSPVYEVMNDGRFPADLEPMKRAMVLENLLTMSAGYFCDDGNDAAPGNEETMWDQTDEPDFYKYTLRVPMATPPGENAVYCSSNPNLALGVVGRATKELPVYSFDRLIAGPMKISNYAWPLDHAANPYGGGAAQFTLRDFAKFGQLMLNGGTWEGRRILSREFVAAASTPQYHLANIYYGYNWWMEDFPYKNRTVRAVKALGAGGQTITVVPELDLVIAFYAANYSSRTQFQFGHTLVPKYLLPAVREAGDDRSAPVVEREYKSPYGRSKDGSRVTSKN